MHLNRMIPFLALTIVMIHSLPVRAQEWGRLSGRFVFTGDVPEAEQIQVTRDEDVCGVRPLFDRSLLVNSENGGLANVVVYLLSRSEVPVHPDLKTTEKPAVLDNKDCQFVPRIVPVQTSQTLRCISTDPIPHNVAVYARRNDPFSEVIPTGGALEKTFPRQELSPLRVDCSSHAWMRAYLVVTDHPYVAVTDKDGRFSIEKIPFGEWEFRLWHEKSGYLATVNINGTDHDLKRGVWEQKIDADNHDLGEVKINSLKD